MSATSRYRITRGKPGRRLLVTVAVSAPIIFWIVAFLD